MANIKIILGIILILSIIGGLLYGSTIYIPKMYDYLSNRYEECEKYENHTTLNVYELDYGENVYLITSANYNEDDRWNNETLSFFANSNNEDSQYITFVPSGKPFRIKMIKSFTSKQDTTSFVKIK